MLRKTNEVVAMKFPRNHRKKLTSLSSSCGTTTAAGVTRAKEREREIERVRKLVSGVRCGTWWR